MGGMVKTLTIKRDKVGRLWLVFSVIETIAVGEASTGESGGFDFGLKTFLVDDSAKRYPNPLYFTQDLHKTRKLNKVLSRKVVGSKHHKRARRDLAKHHAHIANKRRDHQFKLAHELCDAYDTLYFEDLSLQGMKALWGRKVSESGLRQLFDHPALGGFQACENGGQDRSFRTFHENLFKLRRSTPAHVAR